MKAPASRTADGKAALAGLLQGEDGRVLVFDLDDTLLSTTRRHARILREYAARTGLRALAAPDPARARYLIVDTAKDLGVLDPDVLEDLRKFWFERFFVNEYLLEDQPVPGAPEFCRKARASDCRIAYLTGRDGSMKAGTLAALAAHGFPLPGDGGTELLLKPRFDMPDAEFKTEAVERLKVLGGVAGAFENEPLHANLFVSGFPSAQVFLVETRHSGRPVEPREGIHRIPDFLI